MLVLYQAILAVKTSNSQGKAGQGGGEFRFRQSPVGLPSACSHTELGSVSYISEWSHISSELLGRDVNF